MVDLLIVGQGVAGTILSYNAKVRGLSVKVVDKGHALASSAVAAGIINPVTGRKLVKSWNIDVFLPVAKSVFAGLEKLLGEQLYYDKPVIWALDSVSKENTWFSRAGEEAYEEYLTTDPLPYGDYSFVAGYEKFGFYKTNNAGRVDLAKLLRLYRQHLLSEDELLKAEVNVNDIVLHDNHVVWNGIEAKQVVFTQGFQSLDNKYFDLPIVSFTFGEFLIVESKEIPQTQLLKGKYMLVPIGDNKFWYGATYKWNPNVADVPSNMDSKAFLTKHLGAFLNCNYEIIDHGCGIRPNTSDRKPLMGQSKLDDKLCILNGLGSKGTSMVPKLSNDLFDTIYNNQNISDVVNCWRVPKS